MNPDNPNFRTPEEESRAEELVKAHATIAELRAEVEQLKRVVEKLREQRDTLIVHAHDDSATKIQIQTYRANLDAELDAIGKESEDACRS